MCITTTLVPIFCALSLVFIFTFVVSDSPVVDLPQGKLRGKFEVSRNGVQYETYLGIRYASFEKRFDISQPIESHWNGIKDAIEFGPHCVQPNTKSASGIIGEEDCLFLNVFTPKAIKEKKRPVMFYVHGGGFTYGTGAPFGGSFLVDEDVILVTMNYRLGILGFLNVNGKASGNMGLKDQLLALRWVNQNIEYFGGDKSKVTVSGNSAGGASTIYLMLSPATKGLIHNIIPFSGSPLNPWAFSEKSTDQAQKVGKYLNCNRSDLVECFRSKSVEELLAAQASLSEWFMDPMDPFPPTLEVKSNLNPSPFMEVSPSETLDSGSFNPIPALVLMNKDEGIVLYSGLVLQTEALRQDLDKNFERVAPLTFCYRKHTTLAASPVTLNKVTSQIRHFYFGDKEINVATASNLTNVYSDALFGYGIHKTALGLAKTAEVYTGLFTRFSKDFSVAKTFGLNDLRGVGHADEGSYLFNPAIDNQPLQLIFDLKLEEDIEFSRKIVKLVVHFMENSTPNVPSWKSISHKEIEKNTLNWFSLEDDFELKVLQNPFSDRISFWTQLHNNVNTTDFVKDEL